MCFAELERSANKKRVEIYRFLFFKFYGTESGVKEEVKCPCVFKIVIKNASRFEVSGMVVDSQNFILYARA